MSPVPRFVLLAAVVAGKLTEASIAANSPGGRYNAYALKHVRENFNAASEDVTGCLVSISIKLSPR